MSNPNSKAYIPPSSNAVKKGSGIYVPSFPLRFKLSDPNVTSNIVQTLSTLTSEVAATKKKLQGVEVVSSKALAVANKETNGVPQALWSLDVTQTAQMKASYTNDFISCSFTYNTKDPNFGFVRIYVTGLNGGTEPIQVASGATSPITFDMDATGQTVTITAQVVSNGGVSQPFADAVTASLTLNGFSSATGGTQTGYGPLGWPSAYSSAYSSSINFGNYGYSGMSSTFAGGLTTYFYGRFTGYLVPSTTGEYTIGLNSDDGANLYICGQLVGSDHLITGRAMAGNVTYSSGSSCTVLLNAGTYYPIVVEWQQDAGSWGLQLLWTTPGGSAALIPAGNLSTSNSSITSSLNIEAWQGSSGLWHPAIGSGYVDPGNTTIFGPPTNGGGTNLVNGVTAVTGAQTSPQVSPNTFVGPGWLKGQAYSAAGIVDIFVCVGSTTQGYLFRLDYRNAYPALISVVSNLATGLGTAIATATANSAAITGWLNWDIYIGFNGYMALWVNGNLACQVTDQTYNTIPTSGYAGNQVRYFYEVSTTGKLAPAPNASGAGSTALNPQGSIGTVSDYTFSYINGSPTDSTIIWSWTAFSVYCPDGSSYSVAASTGSAVTQSGASGTLTGTAPMEWTGLNASYTYDFIPYVTLNDNGTATVSILCTGIDIPTLAQQVQIANGDGNVPCSGSVYVTAATAAAGGGAGGGTGGGSSHSCFSPNTKIRTQRGDVAITDLIVGEDKVLTARGTWKTVLAVTTRKWSGAMLDMGHEELSTLGHLVKDGTWKQMQELGRFSAVPYEGTIHNVHVHCDWEDDGSALDTEHSYTLANGLVVHNLLTVFN